MSGPPYFDRAEGRAPREPREQRRGGERNRELTKVKCSDCGKECEVPFKPTEGRPVYCRDCFQKHKPRF